MTYIHRQIHKYINTSGHTDNEARRHKKDTHTHIHTDMPIYIHTYSTKEGKRGRHTVIKEIRRREGHTATQFASQAYIQTYIHPSIHPSIHPYIHTYTQAYIYTERKGVGGRMGAAGIPTQEATIQQHRQTGRQAEWHTYRKRVRHPQSYKHVHRQTTIHRMKYAGGKGGRE